MNLDKVKLLCDKGRIDKAELMANPCQKDEWIVFIKKLKGKTFLLVEEQDKVYSNIDLNTIADMLRNIGIKSIVIRL